MIYDDIFRLDIAVNDVLVMQILQSKQSLNEIELGPILTHISVWFEQIKELTSWQIFHNNHIEMFDFKEMVCLYYVGMVQIRSKKELIVYKIEVCELFLNELTCHKIAWP